MKNLKNEKLIFNTAVLSNFARIKKLELIFYLAQKIYTTKEVIEEVRHGIFKKPNLEDIIKYVELGKIEVVSVERTESILLMDDMIQEKILGPGEVSAIALTKELSGIFITDDEVATKKAEKLKVRILDSDEYRDTVSFLEILKQQRIITDRDYLDIKRLLGRENFVF